MKTAMQQLLDKFRGTNWYSADEIEQEFLDFGFPLEKHQIMAANISGSMPYRGISLQESAEKYFNITYGGNE